MCENNKQSNDDQSAQKTDELRNIYRYALICALLWTILISGLLTFNIANINGQINELGYSMAQTSYEEHVLIRRWATMHGGLYVPETAATPPNTYLRQIPDRDVTTSSGKRLTLIHPAQMSRQIFEMAREKPDTPQGHITSLNPIRPENAPDPWETKALKAMAQGAKEVVETVSINGQPHLRFIRSLKVEKGCLDCHAAQGYKEGDNRGGISITLSLTPIAKVLNKKVQFDGLIYSLVWLVGMGSIWFGTRKIIRTMTLLRNERNSLFESEEQLRVIFETSESGIILVSPQGVINFANRRMADMFGMSLGKLTGTSYPEHLHESEKQIGDGLMRQLINGEIQSVSVDRRYIRVNGTDFWGHLSGRRLKNTDGSLRGLVGVISDITGQKLAEQERMELEEKFHHAQKLECLGVLAGGIAHDFNNILTVIIGYCYMAREDLDTVEEYKTSFKQVEKAANRAADLCQQMLTYAGRTESVHSHFSMPLLVDDVVKMLQATINKNVSIELDLNSDVPIIMGDEGQIQQIVMNLIINAAEAIGDVNGTIKVALTKVVFGPEQNETDIFGSVFYAGCYACLEVSDSGRGMDEETQKRIFEPFFTTKFTGRGLGMSAIQGIIKSHKGALQLSSTPGVGTTFKVYLPLTEAQLDAKATSTESTLAIKANGTVLLVDDEVTMRNMGVAMLAMMGFNSQTAEHGREALEIYRERGGEIDVILLDLTMPVMGGIDAYNELRRIDQTVPIVFYSGYSSESVAGIIENDEHAGFVHKPYKPDELRDLILKMMAEE